MAVNSIVAGSLKRVCFDAEHFRQRAARAREMAQFGDDFRISQMLLDLACEMDAEADAMEAGRSSEKRLSPRFCPCESYRALLQVVGENTIARPVQVIDLSSGGAKLRCECDHAAGTNVVLEIPCRGLRLTGTIVRMVGIEAAMVFTSDAAADPTLRQFLLDLPVAAVATMGKARPRRPDPLSVGI